MSRLSSTVRLDLLLHQRYGFYYAAAASALLWVLVLFAIPERFLDLAVPFVVFADLGIVGFYFIAGQVLFEKREKTFSALVSTPLRFSEYLGSKLATLTALAVVVSLVVTLIVYGPDFNVSLVLSGVVITSVLVLLVGFVSVASYDSISRYLVPSQFYFVVLYTPLIFYFGLWQSPVFYLLPTQGPLLMLGTGFGVFTLTIWQLAYAVLYPLVWITGLYALARRRFDKHIVGRRG